MIIPKQSHRSTEFYFTLVGCLAAVALYVFGHAAPAALLGGLCIGSYNISRGLMKAGYGQAASSRTGPRAM